MWPRVKAGRHARDAKPDGQACPSSFALTLRRLLRCYRGLCCRQSGDGHAEGGAAHVVHADGMAEGDAAGVAAVFSTDANFELWFDATSEVGPQFDQLSHSSAVKHLEGIIWQDFVPYVVGKEARAVVTTQPKGGLGEVVGTKAEEISVLGDVIGSERGSW